MHYLFFIQRCIAVCETKSIIADDPAENTGLIRIYAFPPISIPLVHRMQVWIKLPCKWSPAMFTPCIRKRRCNDAFVPLHLWFIQKYAARVDDKIIALYYRSKANSVLNSVCCFYNKSRHLPHLLYLPEMHSLAVNSRPTYMRYSRKVLGIRFSLIEVKHDLNFSIRMKIK